MRFAGLLRSQVRGGATEPPEEAVGPLEVALEQALSAAHAAWPGIDVSDEDFVKYLGARVPSDVPLDVGVKRLRVTDLYLACACLQGHAGALRALEQTILEPLRLRLERTGYSPTMASEVVQVLRLRLVAPINGTEPRLGTFSGQGALASWAHVAAARVAVDLSRAEASVKQGENADPSAPQDARDPEMDLLRRQYLPEFNAAFRATLAELVDRDANVLRLYYIEGMGSQEIAVIYAVTPRSVQMWIADARERILRSVRDRLIARFRLTSTQVDALTGLVQSQLEMSLHQLLRPS
jgi:RNA polymerase sigma-70 factor (ECF subfamily)